MGDADTRPVEFLMPSITSAQADSAPSPVPAHTEPGDATKSPGGGARLPFHQALVEFRRDSLGQRKCKSSWPGASRSCLGEIISLEKQFQPGFL